MNRFKRIHARSIFAHGIAFAVALTLIAFSVRSQSRGAASDGPGVAAAGTTGNKLAVGTSADTTSLVWFAVLARDGFVWYTSGWRCCDGPGQTVLTYQGSRSLWQPRL